MFAEQMNVESQSALNPTHMLILGKVTNMVVLNLNSSTNLISFIVSFCDTFTHTKTMAYSFSDF